MGCNQCSHPSCTNALGSTGISSCVECDGGVLVLDPASGPKWKLGCNKCDVIIHVFEEASRISVEDGVCDCGAQIINVAYKAVSSIP